MCGCQIYLWDYETGTSGEGVTALRAWNKEWEAALEYVYGVGKYVDRRTIDAVLEERQLSTPEEQEVSRSYAGTSGHR